LRIVDIATFLLPLRFSLSDLMAGGGARLKAALTTEFSEFGAAQPIQSEVLLDYHRSVGAMSMETMVFAGETSIPGLDRVQLYISSLSIGFVVISFDVPDDLVVDLESTGPRDSFKAVELEVATQLMPVITRCCERVVLATPPDLVRDRPVAALPAASLLWWHRVAIDPPPGREFPAARWYGVEAELADGVSATVGNGFTNIRGAGSRRVVDDVIEGLMVATQEWLIVDEAKRLLADHLVRLSRSRSQGLISVDAQYHELLELTEEVTLRNLHIAEEVRYLANARSKVKEAAAQAWRMQQEAAELEQRTSALTGLFALHRDRIFNDRDERRNRLVFVFTAVTLIQSVLVWYDFITGDDTTIGGSPRTWIAWVVLILTVVAVGGAIGFRLGSGWWRDVVARRMEKATTRPVPLLRIPTRDEVDANQAAAAGQWAATPTSGPAVGNGGGDPDSGGRTVTAR
jgi:hypothetical protein